MRFYTEIELAQRLNLSRRTLQAWRRQGRGPQWVKFTGAIRYDARVIEEFIEAGRRGPERPLEAGR
jgi:predicted site-specific integrase-resolvase